jgi:hypothetical protein
MGEEITRIEISNSEGIILFKDFIESGSDNVQFFDKLYEFINSNDGTYEIYISTFVKSN